MKNLILLILIVVFASAGYLVFQRINPTLEPEHTGSSKITAEQALEKVKGLSEVQQFLKDVPNGKVEVDNELEGKYNIHVYEIKDGHTATFNWYRVSIKSGEVKKEF